jgi:hypothetical protein
MPKFIYAILIPLTLMNLPAMADKKSFALGVVNAWVDSVNRQGLDRFVDNVATDVEKSHSK